MMAMTVKKAIEYATNRGYEQGKADAQNWIPVTERLPEEHDSIFSNLYGTGDWISPMFRKISKDVIGCLEYEDGSREVKVLHTRDGQWAQTTVWRGTVTHWMPLPQPPKEDA